jgi:hypothetical protein
MALLAEQLRREVAGGSDVERDRGAGQPDDGGHRDGDDADRASRHAPGRRGVYLEN